jgi:hypothetical protein
MHIFIDESGVFQKPTGKPEVVSTVGALCIPSRRLDSLFEAFDKIKSKWGVKGPEIKGSKLSETEVRELLVLLSKHDARAKLIVFDSGVHTEADIQAHKERQAGILTEKLSPESTPSLRAEVESVQPRIANLSLPLYVQFILLTELVAMVFQEFTLWHAMRDGRELARFAWAIDPKDKTRTEYERLLPKMLGLMGAKRESGRTGHGESGGGAWRRLDDALTCRLHETRRKLLSWRK